MQYMKLQNGLMRIKGNKQSLKALSSVIKDVQNSTEDRDAQRTHRDAQINRALNTEIAQSEQDARTAREKVLKEIKMDRTLRHEFFLNNLETLDFNYYLQNSLVFNNGKLSDIKIRWF